MKSGRIEYAPDYKSEKRKPLNSRIKIRPNGRPYMEIKDLVDGALRRDPAASDATAERAQLERAVIEAAKTWREMLYMQARTSRSRAALMAAVDALTEFESKQNGEPR